MDEQNELTKSTEKEALALEEWQKWKVENIALSKAFSDIAKKFEKNLSCEGISAFEREKSYWEKKSEKTGRCAEGLDFLVDKKTDEMKFHGVKFCNSPLCPICNWRKAINFPVRIGQFLQKIWEDGIAGSPLILTVTMENIKSEELKESRSNHIDIFKRLVKYKAVKEWYVGALGTFEVAYNQETGDYTAHDHYLLWMRPDYYKEESYLTSEKWAGLWKKAAKLDNMPVVKIKRISPTQPTEKDHTGLLVPVSENFKYPIKPDAFTSIITAVVNETPKQKQQRLKFVSELEENLKSPVACFGAFSSIRIKIEQENKKEVYGLCSQVETVPGQRAIRRKQ